MAANVKNLLNRDGRYWARMGVPKALRATIGKRELLTALGPDRREALRQLPGAIATMQAALDTARAQANPLRRPVAKRRPLYPWQLAQAQYAMELELDTAQRDAGIAPNDGYDPQAHAALFRDGYRKALAKVAAGHAADPEISSAIGWAIDAFAARGNTAVAPGTPEWRQLARQLAGIQIEVLQRQSERDQGNFAGEPSHPALIAKAEPKPDDPLGARRISPQSDLSLGEIAEQYIKERAAALTITHEVNVTVRLFNEFLAEERPIYRVTRADVRGFAKALAELPANSTKLLPGKTLPESVRLNKQRANPFPALSVKTINDKYLPRLSSIFKWCVRNELLPDNPAEGVKLDSVKPRTAPRVNFSPSDLTKIFGEHFARPFGESEWAMLISLFAGTRASETAQLKLDSVRHERGILVLRVEEETKNLNSQRLIPVHQKLIELGLEARVKELRAKGETHLFPNWYRQGVEAKARAQAAGKETLNLHFPKFIPRRFNTTYLPKVGVDDPARLARN